MSIRLAEVNVQLNDLLDDDATLIGWATLLQGATLRRLLDHVVELACQRKVTRVSHQNLAWLFQSSRMSRRTVTDVTVPFSTPCEPGSTAAKMVQV